MTAESFSTPPTVSSTSDGVIVGADPRIVPVPAPPPAAAGKYSDEDISKARQQEKDKLYPTIEALKESLGRLEHERDERIATATSEADARAAASAEEARLKAESEMDIRSLMEKREVEWAERLAAERHERESAVALMQHERDYQQLEAFRAERIRAEADNIMPELLDLVTGTTRDEIEASIAGLRDRTERIIENVQAATQSARQQVPGTRVTVPANGPLDTTSEQNIANLDLANLSFSDYVKNRERLLGQAAQSRNSGLFS